MISDDSIIGETAAKGKGEDGAYFLSLDLSEEK
jgi:hypothetical protein